MVNHFLMHWVQFVGFFMCLGFFVVAYALYSNLNVFQYTRSKILDFLFIIFSCFLCLMFILCFFCLVVWVLCPLDSSVVSLGIHHGLVELPQEYLSMSTEDRYKLLYAIGSMSTPYEGSIIASTLGLSYMAPSTYSIFVKYLLFFQMFDFWLHFPFWNFPLNFIFFGFLRVTMTILQQHEMIHPFLWALHPSLVDSHILIPANLEGTPFYHVVLQTDPWHAQFWLHYLAEVCYQFDPDRGRLVYIIGSHLSPTELDMFINYIYQINGADPEFFARCKEVIDTAPADAFDRDHPIYHWLSQPGVRRP